MPGHAWREHPRQHRARRAIRRSPAAEAAGVHRHGDHDPFARPVREHRDFRVRGRGAHPAAAVPGSVEAGWRVRAIASGREVQPLVPRLPGLEAAEQGVLHALGLPGGRDRAPDGRRAAAHPQRARERRLLPDARRDAGARPRVQEGRGPPGCAPPRDPQLRRLAGQVRRAERRPRPDRDARRRAEGHRRRAAAGLPFRAGWGGGVLAAAPRVQPVRQAPQLSQPVRRRQARRGCLGVRSRGKHGVDCRGPRAAVSGLESPAGRRGHRSGGGRRRQRPADPEGTAGRCTAAAGDCRAQCRRAADRSVRRPAQGTRRPERARRVHQPCRGAVRDRVSSARDRVGCRRCGPRVLDDWSARPPRPAGHRVAHALPPDARTQRPRRLVRRRHRHPGRGAVRGDAAAARVVGGLSRGGRAVVSRLLRALVAPARRQAHRAGAGDCRRAPRRRRAPRPQPASAARRRSRPGTGTPRDGARGGSVEVRKAGAARRAASPAARPCCGAARVSRRSGSRAPDR